MKLCKIIIVLGISILFFVGGGSVSNSDNKYNFSEKTADLQTKTIMEYIVNRNNEELEKVFCQHIKSTHNLSDEIIKTLEFIDGNIVSYDEPTGYISSQDIKYNKSTKLEFKGEISNVKTDTGKTYRIGISSYWIYDKDESYVGVSFICIEDVNIYNKEYGFPSTGIVYIGEVL